MSSAEAEDDTVDGAGSCMMKSTLPKRNCGIILGVGLIRT